MKNFKGAVFFSDYGQEVIIEKAIFANYSKNSRPVKFASDVVEVGIQFMLAKIERLVSGVWVMYTCKIDTIELGDILNNFKEYNLDWNRYNPLPAETRLFWTTLANIMTADAKSFVLQAWFSIKIIFI